MSYRDQITNLGDRSEQRVLELYDRYEAGEIGHDETVALIAAVVAQANSRAVTLADLSLAATLMLQIQRPVATIGLRPPDNDLDRLHKAATTLLAIEGLTRERVARLARSEPLEAAQRAYSEAMAQSKHVNGWRRKLSANACQLCRWWWREGQVWPADHPMPTHKGCTCSPQPVTKEDQ